MATGGWFGRHIDVNGEQIHFVEKGKGQPLLLLHGFFAWSYTWRHNMEAMSHHARVLALDLRGFGLSERNPTKGHSLDDQVEYVLAFMQALSIERAVICGHSMGGEIALRLALAYPERVRALILVSAAGYVRRERRPAVERMALAVPFVGPLLLRLVVLNRNFAARTLRAAFVHSELVTEADVEAYLAPGRLPGTAKVLLRMLRDSDFGKAAGRFGEIALPCCLLWGENDPWLPLSHGQRLAAVLPDSKLTVFPQCGHDPHEECAEPFNATVIQFLRELDEGTKSP